jgi:hypothetical protein
MTEYTFPDGTMLSSGIAIFTRILATGESATAAANATGMHAGRVLTHNEVKQLCGVK